MAFVPAPDCIQVATGYLWNEQIVENVFDFLHDTPVDHAALVGLGTAVHSWWTTHLQATQSEDVSLTNITLTDLTTQFSESFVYTAGLPEPGGIALPAAAANNSLAVSKRTASRGRSARGRFFHVGSRADYGVNSVYDTAYANSILAAYQQLLSTSLFEHDLLVVRSTVFGGVQRAESLIQPVTAITLVNRVVDSMRRRLPGRGA